MVKDIDSKEGQLRGNLLGKRCDYSGRTVISPEPNLPFGWMAIPVEVSQELTRPEKVNQYNKEFLEKLVNNDKANFIVKSNGTKINLKYALYNKGTEILNSDVIIRGNNRINVVTHETILKIGDKIDRNGIIMEGIKEGDIVLRGTDKIKVKNNNFILKIGDKIERNGRILNSNNIIMFPFKKHIKLEIGDEIHRHLKDGDIVLLNRQPTELVSKKLLC